MTIQERIKNIKNLPPPVREWAVFAAWFGGLLLAAILAWALTGPARSRLMIRQANRSLARQENPLRLEAPVNSRGKRGVSRFGFWFTLGSTPAAGAASPPAEGGKHDEKYAVVFPVLSGVQSAVFLGIVDTSGRAEEIIPLSVNARSGFERFPQGTVNIYLQRIEEHFKKLAWRN